MLSKLGFQTDTDISRQTSIKTKNLVE